MAQSVVQSVCDRAKMNAQHALIKVIKEVIINYMFMVCLVINECFTLFVLQTKKWIQELNLNCWFWQNGTKSPFDVYYKADKHVLLMGLFWSVAAGAVGFKDTLIACLK